LNFWIFAHNFKNLFPQVCFTLYSQRGFIVAQIMDSHWVLNAQKNFIVFFSLHMLCFVILLIEALA
jgi:hypothetical protein